MGPDGADEEQHQADRGGDAERGYADADQQSERANDLEERERDECPARHAHPGHVLDQPRGAQEVEHRSRAVGRGGQDADGDVCAKHPNLRLTVTSPGGWCVYRLDEAQPTDVTVNEQQWLAERFEDNRSHLRAVAYRMLGSVSDADDAVQEFWLRVSCSDPSNVENLQAWFTTGVSRVCLDMLRSKKSRREEPLGPHIPEPIVSREDGVDPEHEALLADSVGLALLVVLETLTPPERLAFV